MIVRAGKFYRHRKTQNIYMVVCLAKMQSDHWIWDGDHGGSAGGESVDYADVVVYYSLHDTTSWVRPQSEFEDGRFEEMN